VAAVIARPGCQVHQGNVFIPFPLRIGAGCYEDEWFEIICENTFSLSRPFLIRIKLEVLNISLYGTIQAESRLSVRTVAGPS
jgi:hypothetical protein